MVSQFCKPSLFYMLPLLLVYVGHRVKVQDLCRQNRIFWHANEDNGITWDIVNAKRLQ